MIFTTMLLVANARQFTTTENKYTRRWQDGISEYTVSVSLRRCIHLLSKMITFQVSLVSLPLLFQNSLEITGTVLLVTCLRNYRTSSISITALKEKSCYCNDTDNLHHCHAWIFQSYLVPGGTNAYVQICFPPKWHLDRFSHFAGINHPCDQLTE